jgi:hypothetical protein
MAQEILSAWRGTAREVSLKQRAYDALFLQGLEGPNKLGTCHHPAVKEASLPRNISLETYRA